MNKQQKEVTYYSPRISMIILMQFTAVMALLSMVCAFIDLNWLATIFDAKFVNFACACIVFCNAASWTVLASGSWGDVFMNKITPGSKVYERVVCAFVFAIGGIPAILGLSTPWFARVSLWVDAAVLSAMFLFLVRHFYTCKDPAWNMIDRTVNS